jgi:hypothetical protein
VEGYENTYYILVRKPEVKDNLGDLGIDRRIQLNASERSRL